MSLIKNKDYNGSGFLQKDVHDNNHMLIKVDDGNGARYCCRISFRI